MVVGVDREVDGGTKMDNGGHGWTKEKLSKILKFLVIHCLNPSSAGHSAWLICLTRSGASPGHSLICLTKHELSKIPDLKDLNFLHPCLLQYLEPFKKLVVGGWWVVVGG